MRPSRRTLLRVILLTIGVLAAGLTGHAQSTSSRGLTIGVTFESYSDLRVSDSVLHVAPGPSAGPIRIGRIDFVARSRTRAGAEVVLTVEALRDFAREIGNNPGQPVQIAFDGSGPGVVAGVLSTEPQTAARWVGSGARSGTLDFTLSGTGRLVGGAIPLRFVLTSP